MFIEGYFQYIYGQHPRPLHQDFSSSVSFDLIRDWLETCDKEHKCYQGGEATLPTRVIDVSHEDPHLLISNGLQSSYITLSHCWGGKCDGRGTSFFSKVDAVDLLSKF